MSTTTVNVAKSVNQTLVPHLGRLGFVVEGDDDGKGWRETRFFRRTRSGNCESIFFGKSKFGRELGLTLAKVQADGKSEYLEIRHKLPMEVLRYETQEELELVLERIRQFIDEEAVPWFDRPFEPAKK
jgi:hypothetical protein